jgi:hypothetical protein
MLQALCPEHVEAISYLVEDCRAKEEDLASDVQDCGSAHGAFTGAIPEGVSGGVEEEFVLLFDDR